MTPAKLGQFIPTSCKKRNGEIVPFDESRIKRALFLCFNAVKLEEDPEYPIIGHELLVLKIILAVENSFRAQNISCPGVEDIQRLIIQQLWSRGLFDAAENYQNYREERRKARNLKELDPGLVARVKQDQRHFPTDIQYYQFISKFARWREKDKRRETWKECVYERVCPWLFKLPGAALTEEEKKSLSDAMYDLEVSPALRVVQMAGPALDRCNVGAYNCAYHPLADIFAFPELLYILMQGTGAGFSVEDKYVSELPRIKKQNGKQVKLVCEDSTEGWCDTFHKHLLHLWDGYDTHVDVSKIRPRNSRLKTKGGRASGPEPFLELIAFSRNLIKSRQGRYLEDIDAHDLACVIGHIVQVGGVRRAAEISLSDLNSRAMREAKSGNWYSHSRHRTMANNSSVFHFDEGGVPVEVFMEEWLSLVKSKSGERGIFNRTAAQKYKPDRRIMSGFGCNPCFTGDTQVWTIYGPMRFDELVGSEVPVLTQNSENRLVFRKMKNISMTRKNVEVFKVKIKSNRRGIKLGEFTATADHIVFLHDGSEKKVGELVKGDRLSSVYRAKANSNGYKQLRNTAGDKDMEHRIVMSWSHGYRPDYPAYHVDHKDDDKSNNHPDNLQVMTAKDHNAKNMKGDDNPIRRFPEKNNLIGHTWGNSGFSGKSHSLTTKRKMSKSQRKAWERRNNHEVTSVEFAGKKDVYDGTVEETHKFFIYTEKDGGVLVHNCAEIILRPFEFCNLSIVVAQPDDTSSSLKRKVIAATYFGKLQSLATNFKYIRPDWKRNCEEERLLGADITGHADCPLLRFDAPGRAELLRELQTEVERVDFELSRRWGVNRSAANTTVKPSGDSAVFFNCASGVSPWHAKNFMRWVREPKDTPVAKFLKDSGVPFADAPENPALLNVFGFPREAPEGATMRNDMTAIQQLENWLQWKTCWAEHSVSCTVYVEDCEWPEVGAWVYKHIDQITGLSFLPKDNGIYTYAPNEELSADKFKEAIDKFPDLNWALLQRYELEDETRSTQEFACVGDKC